MRVPDDAFQEPDHATTVTWRTEPGRRGELLVIGPRTRALYPDQGPPRSCLNVRLAPGSGRGFHDSADLVDRAVPLASIWGPTGERLARSLDGQDPATVFARLVAALPTGDDLVRDAASLLADEPVSVAAQRLHVSERHLRTMFTRATGLSPKAFARIDRVRRVLSGTAPLSEVAAGVGYYDQSHMTAEFRRLMGVTPAAFRSGARPARTPCAL